MDILLIIITVVIVMGIAYILSRPFTNPELVAETPGKTQSYQRQYEDLLREIKILQDECENLDLSQEVSAQIDEKKQLAANLLRKINAPNKDQTTPNPVNESVDLEDTQPENSFRRDGTTVCPQCGIRVASSDKFCTHCGHRLQP